MSLLVPNVNQPLKSFLPEAAASFMSPSQTDTTQTVALAALSAETQAIWARSETVAKEFYTLAEGHLFQEMTQSILHSAATKDSVKEIMRATERRFFLFKYPSDGFQIKGYLSFVPDATQNPLLIVLRGGNQIFGLNNPASDITCMQNFTVLTTTYRGGVSEGTDEFGGAEVQDVPNLLNFLPSLQKILGINLNPPHIYLLGQSRGGMEMFLALARNPDLQKRITKAASLSGLLDMNTALQTRADMRDMFVQDFGLILGKNEEEWIRLRDPLQVIPQLRKDLPILIIQGSQDIRVDLQEGEKMVTTLQHNGNPVTYKEILGGDHCLVNQSNRALLLSTWFEAPFFEPK